MNREYNGTVTQVTVGDVVLGDGQPLALIAGPCVIENESHVLEIATTVREIAERCGMPLIFKASFDKANRTSIKSFPVSYTHLTLPTNREV